MSLVNHSQFRKAPPARVEQRREERHLVMLQRASVSANGSEEYEARLADISSYGCRLEFEQEFPAGTKLQVRFFERDPLAAKVVWCKDGMIGCRFDAAICLSLFRALTIQSM